MEVKENKIINDLLTKIKSYYNNIEIKHMEKIENKCEVNFSYGTSGFRTDVKYLDIVALRISIITFIRSLNISLPIGIMISASHCDYKSNGFKIADINGKMLDKEWEKIYVSIINSKTFIEDIIKVCQENLKNINTFKGKILIGHDTRESSYFFSDIICKCLNEIGANYENYGLVTTPQLHFLTYLSQQEVLDIKYYQKICNINKKFISNIENNVKRIEKNVLTNFSKDLYFFYTEEMLRNYLDMYFKLFKSDSFLDNSNVIIDMANGIGGVKDIKENIVKLLSEMYSKFYGKKEIVFINTEINEFKKLNFQCGSDHIQMDQKFPENYEKYKNSENFIKSCAFDGDGDRLIYL